MESGVEVQKGFWWSFDPAVNPYFFQPIIGIRVAVSMSFREFAVHLGLLFGEFSIGYHA